MKRRQFLVGLAATVTAGSIVPRSVLAGDMPRVSEDDPTAKGLKYVHDASTVSEDVRAAGRYCNNCQLYQGGADDAWAGCAIFPGKQVAGKGWCSAWVAKAG